MFDKMTMEKRMTMMHGSMKKDGSMGSMEKKY